MHAIALPSERLSASARRSIGLVGTALLHVAVFAWPLADRSVERTRLDDFAELEIIEVSATPQAATTLERPPAAGTTLAAITPIATPSIPVEDRRPRRPRVATPAPIPVEPTHDAAAEVPAVEPEPVAPTTTPRDAMPDPSPPAEASAATGGSGYASSATLGGRSTKDYSAYGAAIVRIVKAEIDRDPIPGLRPVDAIRFVVEVLPDGELAWTRPGRYGFVEVLGSTLGPVRTKKILRRIERASARFPAHPQGMHRRRYSVEIEIRFRPDPL